MKHSPVNSGPKHHDSSPGKLQIVRATTVREVEVVGVGGVLCSHRVYLFDARTHAHGQSEVTDSQFSRVHIASNLLVREPEFFGLL